MQTQQNIKNIVFDLGGVLVDWNPRYLFRKIFPDHDEMEMFLREICSQDWNEKQDAGRHFADAVAELTQKHPKYRAQIEAFDSRWAEMLGGSIAGTVEILEALHGSAKYRLLALSNWSHEKFSFAEAAFPFLKYFEGIVVSGRVGMKKPDSRIYQHLCEQHHLVPSETLFIDDVEHNIQAASRLGFATIHFHSPEQLREQLRQFGIFR